MIHRLWPLPQIPALLPRAICISKDMPRYHFLPFIGNHGVLLGHVQGRRAPKLPPSQQRNGERDSTKNLFIDLQWCKKLRDAVIASIASREKLSCCGNLMFCSVSCLPDSSSLQMIHVLQPAQLVRVVHRDGRCRHNVNRWHSPQIHRWMVWTGLGLGLFILTALTEQLT